MEISIGVDDSIHLLMAIECRIKYLTGALRSNLSNLSREGIRRELSSLKKVSKILNEETIFGMQIEHTIPYITFKEIFNEATTTTE